VCRNIKPLYNFEPPASEDEIAAAALQFVRKVSGLSKPSQANQPAFEEAIQEIAEATRRLFEKLETNSPTRDREIEATKAKARSAKRFGENN
jgi:hypothetical protein